VVAGGVYTEVEVVGGGESTEDVVAAGVKTEELELKMLLGSEPTFTAAAGVAATDEEAAEDEATGDVLFEEGTG